MHEARTVSVSIARPWEEVYEAIWRPEDFPKWASGLSASPLVREGDRWTAAGPDRPVRVRSRSTTPLGSWTTTSTSAPARRSVCP